jgi:hypothetical protein
VRAECAVDLKDRLFPLVAVLRRPVPTDAVNMARATGMPAILWLRSGSRWRSGILWFAMRLYVAGRDKGYHPIFRSKKLLG